MRPHFTLVWSETGWCEKAGWGHVLTPVTRARAVVPCGVGETKSCWRETRHRILLWGVLFLNRLSAQTCRRLQLQPRLLCRSPCLTPRRILRSFRACAWWATLPGRLWPRLCRFPVQVSGKVWGGPVRDVTGLFKGSLLLLQGTHFFYWCFPA